MFCRPRKGLRTLVRVHSKDGGQTWLPPTLTTLPNPDAGVDALRTQKGSIYLVHNNTVSNRKELSLTRSTDEGLSWEPLITLESGEGEYSYPCIIQLSPNRLGISYTWNRRLIKYVEVLIP